jgi:hypothetical protein
VPSRADDPGNINTTFAPDSTYRAAAALGPCGNVSRCFPPVSRAPFHWLAPSLGPWIIAGEPDTREVGGLRARHSVGGTAITQGPLRSVRISKRAVSESTLVRGAQDDSRRLACLECFLPARHQRSPGFRPGKPNSGTAVERSLPRDLENSRKAEVITTQIVWLPTSSRPVSQQPSR